MQAGFLQMHLKEKKNENGILLEGIIQERSS